MKLLILTLINLSLFVPFVQMTSMFTNFDYNCSSSGPQPDYCPGLFANVTLDQFESEFEQVKVKNPEASMNTSQIIVNRNYTYETYEIPTQDGYIIRLYRMKPKNGQPGTKGPILMQHGLMKNSDCFFEANVGSSIPERMVDHGYDIWLGNNRGTHYSQKTSSNFTGSNYWNFSWHEMGVFDDPAMIDFILGMTNYTKMGYIGHSQGTSQILVLLSDKPEYNIKLSLVVLLAPVAYVANMSGFFGDLASVFGPTNAFASIGAMFGIPPQIQPVASNLVPRFCQANVKAQALCAQATASYLGITPCNNNCSTLAFILGHYPESVSTKCFWHYSQEKEMKNFAHFDNNPVPGLASAQTVLSKLPKYSTPKNYTLSNISADVVIFHGGLDELSTPPDVARLLGDLGDKVKNVYYYADYAHSDFIHALDIKLRVIDPLISNLADYPPQQ